MTQEIWIAMIALREAVSPDPRDLFKQLATLWPNQPLPEEVTHVVQEKQDVLTFSLATDVVSVSLMREPIPWNDLEGPCRAAWYYWPEAAEAMQEQNAHLLIVMRPGEGTKTDWANRLTRITAATAACSSAVGILWGGSGRIHEPKAFIDTLKETPKDLLPIALWIGFSLIQENDASHSVYTDGMEMFGQMEVEVQRVQGDPQALYECVFNVVHFLLARDIRLQDGETFGVNDEQRIAIRVGPSRAEPEREAVILDL